MLRTFAEATTARDCHLELPVAVSWLCSIISCEADDTTDLAV